jgi:hypothetical protein
MPCTVGPKTAWCSVYIGKTNFSDRRQAAITKVLTAPPFDGQCPCCGSVIVLTGAGQPVPGAEFDYLSIAATIGRSMIGWSARRATPS